jgi:CMP-N-acetylneuraminic acid synthetase
MTPSIAAIVPMRHASQRVPGKNYRSFAGQPLYHHIVSSLLECPLVRQVVIDTDSPTIRADATRNFPHIKLIDRPADLCDGATPTNDVLLHTTSLVASDLYLQTHCTNPLLKPGTMTRAIESLLASYPSYDSLFSVTRVQARLWDGLARAINHNPAILLRTQDLPPVFLENSCIYLFTRATLQANHNRIGQRPMMFEIDSQEAIDIDTESDFRIAELLYAEKNRAHPREAVA